MGRQESPQLIERKAQVDTDTQETSRASKYCWCCSANGHSQNALSFLHYKGNAPCYGNNHQKTLRWQQ